LPTQRRNLRNVSYIFHHDQIAGVQGDGSRFRPLGEDVLSDEYDAQFTMVTPLRE
jgi:hypothetical protein